MIIYTLKIPNELACLQDADLFEFLSSDRQRKVERLHFTVDKRVSLYSELLLKKIAALYLAIHPNKVIVATYAYGKPYIKGHADFYFSISHTRSLIVLAVGVSLLGIDVECCTNLLHVPSVVSHFSQEEQIYIENYSEKKKEVILEIWTKKEAYLKALGLGLLRKLNSFNVLNDTRFVTYKDEENIISLFSPAISQVGVVQKQQVSVSELYDYYMSL